MTASYSCDVHVTCEKCAHVSTVHAQISVGARAQDSEIASLAREFVRLRDLAITTYPDGARQDVARARDATLDRLILATKFGG